MDFFEKIKWKISKGNAKDAISCFKNQIGDEKPTIYNQILLIEGRLSSWEKNVALGLVDRSQFSHESNSINHAILSLLDEYMEIVLMDSTGFEILPKNSSSKKLVYHILKHKNIPYNEDMPIIDIPNSLTSKGKQGLINSKIVFFLKFNQSNLIFIIYSSSFNLIGKIAKYLADGLFPHLSDENYEWHLVGDGEILPNDSPLYMQVEDGANIYLKAIHNKPEVNPAMLSR
ncbi:MAG: hypothetical protein KIS77_11260 [Saprospiraceae bacterium]|nr:hypothetical protein [Saprospiraceae bacterium]